jgi:PA14 domain
VESVLADAFCQQGTLETHGRKIPLNLGSDVDANSRPFDPIQLHKVPSANDPATDAPEQSTPGLTGVKELPGYYFGQVIGGTASRIANGTGWTVTPNTPAPALVGLAIRERPIPDTNLWPGFTAATAAANVMAPLSALNPNYMPFAYGKHWYPTLMPFYPTWVTEGTGSTDDNNTFGYNSNDAWWYAGIAKASASASYLGKGKLAMSSACNAGATVTSNGDDQKYYNNNWQFIHLRRPEQAAVAGVNANLFIEDVGVNGSNYPGKSRHRLQGLPTASAVPAQMVWAATANINTTFGLAGAAAAGQNFSMRCEGFVVPGKSEMYTFGANVSTGARIWVDGRVVFEKWGSSAASTTPIALIKDISYPIVVEMHNDAAPAMLDVQWTCPSLSKTLTLATIPTGNLFTRKNQSFSTANWTSMVARLDPTILTGPATVKAGIMVRPGDGGLSPLLSGRDSFLMLGYSPTRGIFTERRMEPSRVTRQNSNSWYVGSGATLDGVAVPASGIMSAPYPYSGTFVVNGASETHTVVRAATVKASYVVGAPYIEYEGPWCSSIVEDTETAKKDQATIDGRAVNVSYGFTGNGTWSKVATYSKRTLTRVRQTVRLTNSDGTADFSSYGGKSVSLFGPTDNGTTKTSVNPGNVTVIPGSPSSFMGNTRIYTRYSDYAKMDTAAPTVDNKAAKVFQDNWVYDQDDPTKTLAQVVARLNALEWKGRKDWEVAPIAMSAPDTPPDPGVGTPDAKDPPAVTADPFPGTYTFAVATEALTVDISVNSLVTSKGLWFSPSVSKNVPWPAAWTVASLIHPNTGSHAPDMWSNLTATPPAVSATSLQNVATSPRFTDDQPAALTSNKEIWLMLTKKVVAGRDIVSFWYYLGDTPPANAGSYLPVAGFNNVPLTADITSWGTSLLMGPCLQSGSTAAQATALFTDLEVGSTDPGNVAGKFDFNVWDKLVPDGRNPMSAYLASQYQVLWGKLDITEDFFSFQENVLNGRTATEEGFVNPREFWSQSRWWDDGTEKDTVADGTATGTYNQLNADNRQLWARSTFLTLNLKQVQAYLSTTTLPQAINTPISTGSARPASSLIDPVLKNQFNGLIYAARTNRYQWNPSPAAATNPFSYNSTNLPGTALPNGSTNTGAATMLTAAAMNDPSMFHGGVHKLQPYTVGVGMDISEAPPFKPQHFHHGVRLINGSAINWGVSSGGDFGSGGTTIITPNQLFIQGDLNTQTTNVVVPGMVGLQPKNTPLAVVGDQITYLSNSFGASVSDQMDVSRLQGFVRWVPGNTLSNYLPPVLLAPTTVSAASNTTYVAAMITNNQPTTKARVKEGQGAPFIDTMQYLEKWGPGVKMNYKGSLVVVDSRRYTDAFLLDGPRTNGRSPFGVMGWNATWDKVGAANTWAGTVPSVYSGPDRTMSFNRDLLTDQGTPPFTPKGVTSSGLGGWTRIVK